MSSLKLKNFTRDMKYDLCNELIYFLKIIKEYENEDTIKLIYNYQEQFKNKKNENNQSEEEILEKKFNNLTINDYNKESYENNEVVDENNEVVDENNEVVDGFTFDLIEPFINIYIYTMMLIEKTNNFIKNNNHKKKIRKPNFQCHISENIIKFAIYKKYKIMPNWDTPSGDLLIEGDKLECKAFISKAPSSFGPKEKWDKIYFLDATDIKNKNFIVYEIKLSNIDDLWRNLKVNKSEIYSDHCDKGRRPRILFSKIKKALPNDCNIIFKGHLSELNNRI